MVGAGINTRGEVGTLGLQPSAENATCEMASQICLYHSAKKKAKH